MPSFEDYQLIAFTNALQGTLETTTPGNGILASAAQAIGGSNATALMTPFTTQQAIAETTFSFAPANQAVPLSSDPVGYYLGKGSTADDDFEWRTIPSGGTVTGLSVANANGFSGTSDGNPITPEITLTTTITGLLQGNGTGVSAAATTGSGNVVLATSPSLTTPNLGTPSAIDLTNATNVPREQQRVTAIASTATLTPDADTTDIAAVTAQAAGLTIAAPTGTPVDGQRLTIRIRDNGTTRTIAWNAAYVEFATGQLPTDTVVGKTIYAIFWYNAAATAWELVGGNPVAGVWGE
jgi:hypothetical protein